MKKVLFFLILMTGMLPLVNAQQYDYDMPENRGALRVRLSDNAPIKIQLDGKHFGKHGSSLTIGDLPKGRHYLKIFEYDTYEHHSHLIYEGPVRVHKHMITEAVLDIATGYLNENMEEMPPMQQSSVQGGNGYEQGNGYSNNGYNNNNQNNNQEGSSNNGSYRNETPPPPPPPAPARTYVPVPSEYNTLAPDGMAKVEQKVKDKITDTDKLKVLQASLKKKAFTTDQLQQMMNWLNFEESRLELAKWAYSHTTDKENFANMENTQFSQNNRNELDNYINSQQ